MLSGKGQYAQFIYKGLYERYPIANVIVEENSDYRAIVKRRIKKLGFVKVIGQYLFAKYVLKKLMKT